MKETIITVKRKKTELITLLVCFIIANLFNLYAIIAYNTSFTELFTQLGYVALFAIALYVLWTVIRVIFYGLKKLFRRNKKLKQ